MTNYEGLDQPDNFIQRAADLGRRAFSFVSERFPNGVLHKGSAATMLSAAALGGAVETATLIDASTVAAQVSTLTPEQETAALNCRENALGMVFSARWAHVSGHPHEIRWSVLTNEGMAGCSQYGHERIKLVATWLDPNNLSETPFNAHRLSKSAFISNPRFNSMLHARGHLIGTAPSGSDLLGRAFVQWSPAAGVPVKPAHDLIPAEGPGNF